MIIAVEDIENWLYHVEDAHGNAIEHVTWANTETGEVRQIVFDEDGRPATEIRFDGAVVCSTKLKTYPAPLRVTRITDG